MQQSVSLFFTLFINSVKSQAYCGVGQYEYALDINRSRSTGLSSVTILQFFVPFRQPSLKEVCYTFAMLMPRMHWSTWANQLHRLK
ncbi:MAG: hypothetical protein ACOYZ8_00115, partial [Chloroflexota bacterium]